MRSAVTKHPVWTMVILGIGAFLALLGSRIVGAEPVRGDVPGFHQRVRTDSASYSDGDQVRMTFTVCRTRPWLTRTASTGGTNLLSNWRVVDATGRVVADNSHGVHTLEGRSVVWLPGQCRRTEFEWDQHHWNLQGDPDDPTSDGAPEGPQFGGVPVIGDRVPSGSYHVEAWWLTGPIDVSFGPQPSVSGQPFQIEP